MSIKKVLFEDSEVLVAIMGQNELVIYSKVDDPPKIRLGAPGGTLGAIYFDNISGGSAKETVLIMGKDHDPDSPNDSLKCGALDTQIIIEGATGTDADMKKVSLQTPHRANFRVPLEQGSSTVEVPASKWPAQAPVSRGGAGGTGTEWIPIYRNYMAHDVQAHTGRTATSSDLALVDEYRNRYGYLDDMAYNWLLATFIL